MKKKPELKYWIVPVEYTVRGTVIVEAACAEDITLDMAHTEMECPPTCEISDWDARLGNIREAR